jgi:hypothetical protein
MEGRQQGELQFKSNPDQKKVIDAVLAVHQSQHFGNF